MEQDRLICELQELNAKHLRIGQHFERMNEDALNTRPEDKGWTILECIEHINLYSEFYVKEFRRVVAKGKPKTERPYSPGFMGGKSALSMLPNEQGRPKVTMNTFKKMNPASQKLDKKVVRTLIAYSEAMSSILEEVGKVDLNRNRCKLTLPVLTFSLGDTLRFHLYHNERHLRQAERVLT